MPRPIRPVFNMILVYHEYLKMSSLKASYSELLSFVSYLTDGEYNCSGVRRRVTGGGNMIEYRIIPAKAFEVN